MGCFHQYLFQGFLIILMQESIASKRIKDKGCSNWNTKYHPDTRNRGSKELLLTFSCEEKYQLLDIDVVAGKDILNENFDGTVTVFGYTPSLMVDISMCYWRQNCTIPFPQDVMFSCVSVNSTDGACAEVRPNNVFSETSCFLEDAEFLRPVRAKCVKNKLVKAIFDVNSGKPIPTTKLPKRKGLIKSHDSYPWNYYEIYQDLTYRYKFRLSRKVLILGLKFVHVCDGDSLVLNTKVKKGKDIAGFEENKQLKFTRKVHGFVELELHISRDSKGCGGFLICYNEVKRGKLDMYGDGKKNVCNDLIKKTAQLEKRDDFK